MDLPVVLVNEQPVCRQKVIEQAIRERITQISWKCLLDVICMLHQVAYHDVVENLQMMRQSFINWVWLSVALKNSVYAAVLSEHFEVVSPGLCLAPGPYQLPHHPQEVRPAFTQPQCLDVLRHLELWPSATSVLFERILIFMLILQNEELFDVGQWLEWH